MATLNELRMKKKWLEQKEEKIRRWKKSGLMSQAEWYKQQSSIDGRMNTVDKQIKKKLK